MKQVIIFIHTLVSAVHTLSPQFARYGAYGLFVKAILYVKNYRKKVLTK